MCIKNPNGCSVHPGKYCLWLQEMTPLHPDLVNYRCINRPNHKIELPPDLIVGALFNMFCHFPGFDVINTHGIKRNSIEHTFLKLSNLSGWEEAVTLVLKNPLSSDKQIIIDLDLRLGKLEDLNRCQHDFD